MRNDAEAVVEGLYAAWRLQDVEATLCYCTPNIRYTVHQPEGVTGVGGESFGQKALRSRLQAMCATWEFEYLAPASLCVDGNCVRAQLVFRSIHRRSGLPLAGTKRQVWHVEDGRVASCDEYQDAVQIKAFLKMADAS